MHWQRIIFNFKIGIEALFQNRFRAVLTSLGIIFGVASVIAMLAIGKGAEKEILEQIKQVGSNNVIIRAVKPNSNKENGNKDGAESGSTTTTTKADKQEQKNFSPGLNMADVRDMTLNIPTIDFISPEIEMQSQFMFGGLYTPGKLIGVDNNYFKITDVELAEGSFFRRCNFQMPNRFALSGKILKQNFFAGTNPLGQYLKCGNTWLKVVGMLGNKDVVAKDAERLSIRNLNNEVYTPVNTVLIRYTNRCIGNSEQNTYATL